MFFALFSFSRHSAYLSFVCILRRFIFREWFFICWKSFLLSFMSCIASTIFSYTLKSQYTAKSFLPSFIRPSISLSFPSTSNICLSTLALTSSANMFQHFLFYVSFVYIHYLIIQLLIKLCYLV